MVVANLIVNICQVSMVSFHGVSQIYDYFFDDLVFGDLGKLAKIIFGQYPIAESGSPCGMNQPGGG